MTDPLIALLFACMVVVPCGIARLICISHDRAPILIVAPDRTLWD